MSRATFKAKERVTGRGVESVASSLVKKPSEKRNLN